MPEPLLSDQQIQRLLKFKGYGNPAGPFWFIGMEEYSDQPLNELARRAGRWNEIEDLAEAPRPWAPEFKSTLHQWKTWTWWIMCKVVGRLSGRPWRDTDFVRCYQSTRLGRKDDETFLTEMLPLPKKDMWDWPFGFLYPTRQDYEDAVRPDRIEALRELFTGHEPEYVFCYGKTNWKHYISVFREAEFTPILDGAAQIATVSKSTIVLTAFFTPTIVGKVEAFVERLGHEVEAERATGSGP